MTNYWPLIKYVGRTNCRIKRKNVAERVLDAEGPTVETSISARGSMKETQVSENLTYIAKPVSLGVLHGRGQGVVMAGESDMVAYTGEGVGRLSPSSVKWRGAIYYVTSSTGRLAFLNNVVGVFESEVDLEGNFTDKIWEWK